MSSFNFIKCKIQINENCPKEFESGSLQKFYNGPNHGDWSQKLSRILMHETFHFWQVLSSAYLANIVQEEWIRLQHLETTGDIKKTSELYKGFRQRKAQFSAYELFECWARFWDVHTFNPERVLTEDQLKSTSDSMSSYPGHSFDKAMTKGEQHSQYAAPYLWVLERLMNSAKLKAICSLHESPQESLHEFSKEKMMASYLTCLLFPAITFSAFDSKDPVGVFTKCFENVAEDGEILNEILKNYDPNINFSWLNSWSFLLGEVIYPVLDELEQPNFTAGLEVVERGELGGHPLYQNYVQRHIFFQKFGFPHWADHFIQSDEMFRYGPQLSYALINAPKQNFWTVFALPGQPVYRNLLGTFMQAPVIQFKNTFVYPRLPLSEVDESRQAEHQIFWKVKAEELNQRVEDYEIRKFALQHGLQRSAFA